MPRPKGSKNLPKSLTKEEKLLRRRIRARAARQAKAVTNHKDTADKPTASKREVSQTAPIVYNIYFGSAATPT